MEREDNRDLWAKLNLPERYAFIFILVFAFLGVWKVGNLLDSGALPEWALMAAVIANVIVFVIVAYIYDRQRLPRR